MKPIAKLALVPHADQPHHHQPVEHACQALTLALQTTLDIERLLELFSEHLQASVSHDSYGFYAEDAAVELKQGKRERHQCSYQLALDTQTLGEWRMSRARRFSEQELATLEAYLCRLLFPLRNALLYRQALQTAYTDPLTGVRNRGALLGSFQREWEFAKRHHSALSVVMIDIDHFKQVNDTYGHDRGDEVLRQVALCVKDTVRASDIVFRFGGEEFVALLGHTEAEGAWQLAERIRSTLENTTICSTGGGSCLRVTASLGVATLAEGDENKEMLLKRADLALYQAKNLGRNRVEVAA
jgi:diguanylate cyclase (GGDEF)-like protein